LERCKNPNAPNYEQYGARGIRVCAAWHDYETFVRDIGKRSKRSSSVSARARVGAPACRRMVFFARSRSRSPTMIEKRSRGTPNSPVRAFLICFDRACWLRSLVIWRKTAHAASVDALDWRLTMASRREVDPSFEMAMARLCRRQKDLPSGKYVLTLALHAERQATITDVAGWLRQQATEAAAPAVKRALRRLAASLEDKTAKLSTPAARGEIFDRSCDLEPAASGQGQRMGVCLMRMVVLGPWAWTHPTAARYPHEAAF